jgi:hypothetical protein
VIILIEELYTQKECDIIRELFSSEPETTKDLILQAISSKVIIDKDKILLSNPLDLLYMVCSTAKFADSEDECQRIALIVYQYFSKPKNVLPMVSEDVGLNFATKTLIALTFYLKAMEHRWKHHGAPTPAFYRKISKATFELHGQSDIATHHEQWENFLSEMFV